MNIKISTPHFVADQKLLEFVDKKVKKMEQFYEGILGVEVVLKVEKAQESDNKVAEIKLEIRGNDLFAKKQATTFEEAVDLSIDALKKQITKYKEKLKRL
jgi:ribosomal subunit interface protein